MLLQNNSMEAVNKKAYWFIPGFFQENC